MTKKEFKHAMLRGLGRCIQELKSCGNPEKYRNIILWGCTHNLSFDTQCEGTRSYYLYQMVKCYSDVSPFLHAVILQFYKSMRRPGWNFSQFCEFLALFAGEGNPAACRAFRECYRQLYRSLSYQPKNRISEPEISYPDEDMAPRLEHFEQLCISIVNSAKTTKECKSLYFKIAEDIGLLIAGNPLFVSWTFDWFQACFENEFGETAVRKSLEDYAGHRKGIKIYWNAMTAQKKEYQIQSEAHRKKTAYTTAAAIYGKLQNKAIIGRDIPVFAARHLQKGENEAQKLADYYRTETDPDIRTQLLRLLSNKDCAKLLPVEQLIEDSRSGNTLLEEYAFLALGNIKDDRVHAYAKELLHKSFSQR